MNAFELVEPRTIEDAFGFLRDADVGIRPMGGGTALMLMMKAQLFTPARLVSLRLIDELKGIRLDDAAGVCRIGAMTTFSELENSKIIADRFPIVTRAMADLANVRVRNVATVGGNIAHGDPHLDLPPIWTALDVEVVLRSAAGRRAAPIQDIFAGYYATTISDGELISEIRVPIRPNRRATYVKVTTRAIHDWPALGISIAVTVQEGRFKDARLVLSAAVDRPTRLFAAEAALEGGNDIEAAITAAALAAAIDVEMESDARGSVDFKKQLLRVHLTRALRNLVRE